MKPAYSWTCHSCAAANPAGVDSCSSCNFPALATSRAIELARPSEKTNNSKLESRATESSDDWERELQEQLSQLPLGKRILAIVLLILALSGFVAFVALYSVRVSTIGLFVFLMSIGLSSLLIQTPKKSEATKN